MYFVVDASGCQFSKLNITGRTVFGHNLPSKVYFLSITYFTGNLSEITFRNCNAILKFEQSVAVCRWG